MSFNIIKYDGPTDNGRVLYDMPWADVVLDSWYTPETVKKLDLSRLKRLPSSEIGPERWPQKKHVRFVRDGDTEQTIVTAHFIRNRTYRNKVLFRVQYPDGLRVAFTYPKKKMGNLTTLKTFLIENSKNLFNIGMYDHPGSVKLVSAATDAIRNICLNLETTTTVFSRILIYEVISNALLGFVSEHEYAEWSKVQNKVSNSFVEQLIFPIMAGFTITENFDWITGCSEIRNVHMGWDIMFGLKNQGVSLAAILEFNKQFDQIMLRDKDQPYITNVATSIDQWWKTTRNLEGAAKLFEAGLNTDETYRLLTSDKPIDWAAIDMMRALNHTVDTEQYV